MDIVHFKKVGMYLFEKMVDAIIYLADLLLRFLDSRGWSPKLKIKI
jgi:hypothetical protein